MTRTVILGGGFGGITAARILRKLVPDPAHEIVVVDRSPSFIVGAAKTWVMLGESTSDKAVGDRKAMLPDSVRLVESEVLRIAPRDCRVGLASGDLPADFLVIALGVALNLYAIPGLAAADSFYELRAAEDLHRKLKTFPGGRVVILIPRVPFQCPPAPYEAAILLDEFFQRRGIREKTRISIYSIEGAPMATAGPQMGEFIKAQLAKHNVEYRPLHATVAVDPEGHEVKFENGATAAFDLLIAVPPHEAPVVVRDAGLLGPSGWIPVDPLTLRVQSIPDRQIYAIGDIAGVPLPGRFKPDVALSLPKAGTLAEAQGQVVAAQIAAQILGTPANSLFAGEGFCYIELGGGAAIRGNGQFFAMPHPVMHHSTEGPAQLQEKREWVSSWLRP